MPRPTPSIGCTPDEIETPFLYLDLDVMDRNIASMVTACQEYGVEWRPHAKCHKQPEIGRQLVNAGAIGLTCAKLSEAEVFAEHGIRDLLIANLLVGNRRCARFAALCQHADPIAVFDHHEQVDRLDEALGSAGQSGRAIIEIDIGMARVGVSPGDAAVTLARRVERARHLRLVGIMGYEGHLLFIDDPDEKRAQIADAIGLLADTRHAMQRDGLCCDIVSCGGTGSFTHTLVQPAVTELQAGGAIFMDAYYRDRCQVSELDFALTLVATVVSHPTTERAIIDAGRKSLSMEIHMPRLRDRPDIAVVGLSAEHGKLDLSHAEEDIEIGQRLHVLPGYADLTNNLHDTFFGFRDGRLERLYPIVARGHFW